MSEALIYLLMVNITKRKVFGKFSPVDLFPSYFQLIIHSLQFPSFLVNVYGQRVKRGCSEYSVVDKDGFRSSAS